MAFLYFIIQLCFDQQKTFLPFCYSQIQKQVKLSSKTKSTKKQQQITIVEMIERLQQISQEIFKAALRTYTKHDVLVHKRASTNNLTQMLSMFPNKGVGFHIFKKSWTPGLHYQIKRAQFKSYRHGHFYGIKYIKMSNGKVKAVDIRPKRLNGFSKRGCWTYSLGDFQQCKTDNGIIYTKEDYQAFVKIRGIGMPKIVQNQIQVNESENIEENQQNQEQNRQAQA